MGRVDGGVGAMRHRFSSVGSRVPVPVAVLVLALALAGCGGPGADTGAAGGVAPAAAGAQDVRAVAPVTAPTGSGPNPAGETGEIGTATSSPAPSPSDPAELPGLGPRTLAEVPDNARQVLIVTGKDKDSSQSRVVLYERRTADSGWTAGRTWAPVRSAEDGHPDHR
ncbi:hypothetical protein [Streptomyces sp. GQFP]|uniref:hypothetical protein n=1 Tax=Streptomyces sp. GQFP TaxID=2907545 RepID=UPI001F2F4A71|nr:hypothetical protein [Streptomyces sp. GQFP]UIX33863.1 hypothetical protein LUX31_29830 [Streptomyces sp. GQFP]